MNGGVGVNACHSQAKDCPRCGALGANLSPLDTPAPTPHALRNAVLVFAAVLCLCTAVVAVAGHWTYREQREGCYASGGHWNGWTDSCRW